MKKRLHNQHRRSPRTDRGDRGSRTRKEETTWDSCMVRYLQMVVSLIEGRRVSDEEIQRMLVQAVRQHSMARRCRRDYVLSCWKGSVESP